MVRQAPASSLHHSSAWLLPSHAFPPAVPHSQQSTLPLRFLSTAALIHVKTHRLASQSSSFPPPPQHVCRWTRARRRSAATPSSLLPPSQTSHTRPRRLFIFTLANVSHFTSFPGASIHQQRGWLFRLLLGAVCTLRNCLRRTHPPIGYPMGLGGCKRASQKSQSARDFGRVVFWEGSAGSR